MEEHYMLRDIGVGVAVLVKNKEGKVLLLKRIS